MEILQNAIISKYKNGKKGEVDSIKAIEENIIERRQKLIDKLLTKELKDLKKLAYKFKHRQFLKKKLIVIALNMDEEDYIGLYQKIEDKKRPSRYIHKISISESTIDDYLKIEDCGYYIKKCLKQNICKILRHEIIHAFTSELIGDWTDIEGANRDSSPFFLALLFWFGGNSNHNCVKAFKHSPIYKETKHIKTFDLLDIYLVHKLNQFEKITSSLVMQSTWNTNNRNKFSFSYSGVGLVGNSSIRYSSKDLKTGEIKEFISNNFEIGCCIMPNDIEKYLIRRCNNDNFISYISKKYYIKENYMCTIENGELRKIYI